MAVLEGMPDRATIVAMRGKVDYYYWKGIPVARAWPRKSIQPRQEGEVQSSQAFTAAAKLTSGLPSQVVELYKRRVPSGVDVTWVDFVRSLSRVEKWVLIG